MFRLPSNDGSGDDSDDSISITSTVFSEDDPDNTYIVENILAERYFSEEERTKYLVKWEGYPIERASWEPIEMFDDKNTINEWKAMKQRQESGNSSPQFDWRQWDADREKELHDQHVRKLRRMRKRQKLQKAMGKPASSRGSRASSAKIKNFVVSDDEIVVSPEEESESDVQRRRRRRRRRPEDKESEEIEEEEVSGNTSADSLMESLAKKAQKKRGRGRNKKDTNAPEPKKQKVKTRGRRSVEDSEDEDDSQGEHFYVEGQTSSKKVIAHSFLCNPMDLLTQAHKASQCRTKWKVYQTEPKAFSKSKRRVREGCCCYDLETLQDGYVSTQTVGCISWLCCSFESAHQHIKEWAEETCTQQLIKGVRSSRVAWGAEGGEVHLTITGK